MQVPEAFVRTPQVPSCIVSTTVRPHNAPPAKQEGVADVRNRVLVELTPALGTGNPSPPDAHCADHHAKCWAQCWSKSDLGPQPECVAAKRRIPEGALRGLFR